MTSVVIERVRERYENDPAFRHTVDAMVAAMANLNLTPSEMREAAMFASVRFDMYHVRRWVVPRGISVQGDLP